MKRFILSWRPRFKKQKTNKQKTAAGTATCCYDNQRPEKFSQSACGDASCLANGKSAPYVGPPNGGASCAAFESWNLATSRRSSAVRAGSADLTAPRKLLLSFPSPHPSRAQAGTLACCVPHGAAPTPDGEWARRPYTPARGFRCAAPLAASPLFCLEFVRPHLAAFLFF